MSRMAADWPEWASSCAQRRTRAPEPVVPASFTLTASGPDGVLWRSRVDVATGESRDAAVVLPFRRRA